MPVSADSAHERPNKLESDDEDEENDADNLARAALSQPTLDPGENHASEQNVKYPERYQHERSPEKKTGPGNANSNCQPDEPKSSQCRGRIQTPVHQPDHEIRWKRKRKPKQV